MNTSNMQPIHDTRYLQHKTDAYSNKWPYPGDIQEKKQWQEQ